MPHHCHTSWSKSHLNSNNIYDYLLTVYDPRAVAILSVIFARISSGRRLKSRVLVTPAQLLMTPLRFFEPVYAIVGFRNITISISSWCIHVMCLPISCCFSGARQSHCHIASITTLKRMGIKVFSKRTVHEVMHTNPPSFHVITITSERSNNSVVITTLVDREEPYQQLRRYRHPRKWWFDGFDACIFLSRFPT